MSDLAQAGYSRILKTEIEQETAWVQIGTDCGMPIYAESVVYGVVWVVAEDGIYIRETMHGEMEESNKDALDARGFTDDLCILVKARDPLSSAQAGGPLSSAQAGGAPC